MIKASLDACWGYLLSSTLNRTLLHYLLGICQLIRDRQSDPRISIPDICPSVRSPGWHQGTSGLCTESCCALDILTHTVHNIRFNSRGRSLLPGISTRRHLCWADLVGAFVQSLGTAYNWMYRAGELLGHFVLHTHLLNHKDIFHLEGNILCGIA